MARTPGRKALYEAQKSSKSSSNLTSNTLDTNPVNEIKKDGTNVKNSQYTLQRVRQDLMNSDSNFYRKYVHSNTYIYEDNVANFSGRFQKDEIVKKLKKILEANLKEELEQWKRWEAIYLNNINSKRGTSFKDINELVSEINSVYSETLNQNFAMGHVVNFKLQANEFAQKASKFKEIQKKGDPNLIRKAEEELRKEADASMKKMAKIVSNLLKWLEGEIAVRTVSKDALDYIEKTKEASNFQKLKEQITIALQDSVSEGVIPEEIKNNLESLMQSQYFDSAFFMNYLNATAQPSTNNFMGKVLQNVNIPAKLGFAAENALVDLFIESTMSEFTLLPEKINSKKNKRNYMAAGEKYQQLNVTDVILGEIQEKGKKIILGSSLKIKGSERIDGSYAVISDFLDNSELESGMKDKYLYMRRNFKALSTFSDDGIKPSKNISDIDKEMTLWYMVPRFLNALNIKLKDGTYAPEKGEDLVFTIFVVSTDKIILTSTVLEKLYDMLFANSSFDRKRIVGVKNVTMEIEKENVFDSRDKLVKLLDAKKTYWSSLNGALNLYYDKVLSDTQILNILDSLEKDLTQNSVAKVFYRVELKNFLKSFK